MEPMKNPEDAKKLSSERVRIAKIFKKHIEDAIAELGQGYEVDLQGRFDTTPIRLEVEVKAQEGEIP